MWRMLALVLPLVTAPPIARAQFEVDEPPPYEGRYAPPPEYREQSEQADLADQLVEDTADLRNRIEREMPGDERGRQVSAALWQLQQRAQRFEQALDNLGPGANPTREEFGRLVNAYGRAANAVEGVPLSRDTYREFAQVRRTMDRLAPLYGGYGWFGYSYANRGYLMRGPGLSVGIGGFRFEINP